MGQLTRVCVPTEISATIHESTSVGDFVICGPNLANDTFILLWYSPISGGSGKKREGSFKLNMAALVPGRAASKT